MLREAFSERLKQAMRAKDARTLSAVRMILAALKDRDIAARGTGNTAGDWRRGNPAAAAGDDQAAARIDRAVPPGQPSRTGRAGRTGDRGHRELSADADGRRGDRRRRPGRDRRDRRRRVKDMSKVMGVLRSAMPGLSTWRRPARSWSGCSGEGIPLVRTAGILPLAQAALALSASGKLRFAESPHNAGGTQAVLKTRSPEECMAFPPGFLDELRARVSLADLVGRRVRLVRRGREHSGLCPFHNEKTPSFYVVEDKGFFHCFGCGAHGDAIGFLMRADNLDFIEAVERLAGEAGIAVPHRPCRSASGRSAENIARRAGSGGRILRGAALGSGGGAGARLSDPARSRRGDDPAVPSRLGAGGPAVVAAGARERVSGSAVGRGRAASRVRQWRRPIRLLPRPDHLPDRRPRRPDYRLRRAHARRRPAEIPEFSGYAGFREGENSLWLGGGARRSSRARADAGGARR